MRSRRRKFQIFVLILGYDGLGVLVELVRIGVTVGFPGGLVSLDLG